MFRALPFLLIDVNTQQDFFADDAPARIDNAPAVQRRIKEVMQALTQAGLPRLVLSDAHEPGDEEFAAHKLAPHALNGSKGQEKIFETQTFPGTAIIPPSGKRVPWPQVSDIRKLGKALVLEKRAFNGFSNPALPQVLESFNAEVYVLMGAALEHDIAETALEARKTGQPVTVLEDATGSLDPEKRIECKGALMRRGVHFEPAEEFCVRIGLWKRKQERQASS